MEYNKPKRTDANSPDHEIMRAEAMAEAKKLLGWCDRFMLVVAKDDYFDAILGGMYPSDSSTMGKLVCALIADMQGEDDVQGDPGTPSVN